MARPGDALCPGGEGSFRLRFTQQEGGGAEGGAEPASFSGPEGGEQGLAHRAAPCPSGRGVGL